MPPTNTSVAEAYVSEAKEQLAKAAKVLRHCLDQLTDEQLSWRPHQSMNSIGNLILHLCGNVHQWITSGVGGETDMRNRPSEFADRGPFAKGNLNQNLAKTVEQVNDVLSTVESPELLESRRTQGFESTGLSAIFDSVAHFKGHTQEIVCLTRMQLGDNYGFEWAPTTPEEGAP